MSANKPSEAFVFDLVTLKSDYKAQQPLPEAGEYGLDASDKVHKSSRDSAAENYKARNI